MMCQKKKEERLPRSNHPGLMIFPCMVVPSFDRSPPEFEKKTPRVPFR